MTRTRFLIFALLILLFAAAFRISGAGAYPVWTDEGWSIQATGGDLAATLTNIANDRHPPLYFLLLHAGQALFGESRLGLRLMSIIGGLLVVAVVMQLGKSVFGRRTGVFAGLLFAALPIAAYYSQELRPYGWLTLFVTLSWGAWLRLLRRPTRGRMVVYALSMAGAMYCNYFAVFPLIVQVVAGGWWVVGNRDRGLGVGDRGEAKYIPRLLAAYLLAFILYLPWVGVIAAVQWPILQSGISGFPGTLRAEAGNLLPLMTLLFGVGAALFVGLYAVGVSKLRRVDGATWSKWAMVAGGGGLLVGMVALALRFDFLAARTLVMLTPLLVLLPAWALAQLNTPPRTGLLLAGVFVLFSWQTSPERANAVQGRLDSDTLVAALQPQVAPGDLVVLETGWDDNALAYELGQALTGATIVRTIPWTDRFRPQPVVPQLEGDLANTRRVWIVQWLQAPQALPYLEGGGSGYLPSYRAEVDAGDYAARFGDANFTVARFDRPDLTQAPVVYLAADGRGNAAPLFRLRDAIFTTPGTDGRLHLDLWWDVAAIPPLDYSFGVYALSLDDLIMSQDDRAPDDPPTSAWQPGTLYHTRHTLAISRLLTDFEIGISAYWYADPQPLAIEGAPGARYAVVE